MLNNLIPCHRGLFTHYKQDDGEWVMKEIQAWGVFHIGAAYSILPMVIHQAGLICVSELSKTYKIVTEQDMPNEMSNESFENPNTL